jgi:hypothetical protein
MDPPVGIEPTTSSLQNWRSATELQGSKKLVDGLGIEPSYRILQTRAEITRLAHHPYWRGRRSLVRSVCAGT